jgi:hypothetical protein
MNKLGIVKVLGNQRLFRDKNDLPMDLPLISATTALLTSF